MKEKFLELYRQFIHREGSEELLAWLERSDMFSAPASTQFHLAERGGLCAHSVHVFQRLVDVYKMVNPYDIPDATMESLAICGLLHDLCKVNFYTESFRNVKNAEGKWESVPFYKVEDKLCYGHGEGSVYIISGFMKLTREEALAIRWHMGGFTDSVRGGSYALNGAYEKYQLCPMLNIADMMATYLDEVE